MKGSFLKVEMVGFPKERGENMKELGGGVEREGRLWPRVSQMDSGKQIKVLTPHQTV